MDLEKKRSSRASLFKVFEVMYYFSLASHFIGCAWLITGRLDPNRVNWYEMAFYNKFPDVT